MVRNDTNTGDAVKPENVRCPTCDGPMVPRTGRHGKFWGCANYPRCKGTRNSMGSAPNRFESGTDNGRDQDETPSERWKNRDRRRWE